MVDPMPFRGIDSIGYWAGAVNQGRGVASVSSRNDSSCGSAEYFHLTGSFIRAFDVSNPSTTTEISKWSTENGAMPHNVLVKGDLLYISYYTEGLQVLNIAKPHTLYRVAFFDTWPGVPGSPNGNWGVYPFAKSGNIYLSDTIHGLFVVRLNEDEAVADFSLKAPETQTAHPGQSTLLFSFDAANVSTSDNMYDITVSNTLGWSMSFPSSIRIPPYGTELVSVAVTVPGELRESVDVDVELCFTSRVTSRKLCATTDPTVSVVLQSFQANALSQGQVELSWELNISPGEQGNLIVYRDSSEAATEWNAIARLPLQSKGFVDKNVIRGESYHYLLALEQGSGEVILGERSVKLEAPIASRVLGNFPNPFNPSTKIRFELDQPSKIQITIFDARGQKIQVLRPGNPFSPGINSVRWNGKDSKGQPLTSGTYFYEIRSDAWVGRGKMSLLR